jgi:hypothetical protein
MVEKRPLFRARLKAEHKVICKILRKFAFAGENTLKRQAENSIYNYANRMENVSGFY